MMRRVLLAFALVAAPTLLRGQDPTKLPTVVTKADSGRVLRGVVLDTNEMIVPEAEIVIGALKRRVIAKSDGTFIFTDMPKGTYEIRARKIGYGPQVKIVKVTSDGGAMEPFELVPIPRLLPGVVTASSRLGLSGVVADTSFAGLPGVDVKIVGSGLQVLSDSTGAFWMPAKPGSHFVTFHRAGFRDRMVSVDIPSDTGRKITVSLLPGEASVRESMNIFELQHRIARVTEPFVNLYSRERIKSMGIEFAYDVGVSGWIQSGNTGLPDFTCYAVINGGPRIARLNSISIDEIESIEVYAGDGFKSQKARAGQTRGSGSAAAASGLRALSSTDGKASTGPDSRSAGVAAVGPQNVADSRPSMDMENTDGIAKANQGKICPTVYVWTR